MLTVLLAADPAAVPAGFDLGSVISQLLVSLITPTVILAPFFISRRRRQMAADARATDSAADETDAKAEVLLSGEALELFRAARQDATEARVEAGEARAEAGKCRRMNVTLWERLDEYDRHVRRLEHAIEDAGGVLPPRPLILAAPVGHDPGDPEPTALPNPRPPSI